MEDGNMADRPLGEAELFREVFDLADEVVGQITDTEVEERLHRFLQRHNPNGRSPFRLRGAGTEPDSDGLNSGESRGSGDEAAISVGRARQKFGTATQHVTYEVTLGPAAIRAIRNVVEHGYRKVLADALRTELADGPNAGKEIELRFSPDDVSLPDPDTPDSAAYKATPLSIGGYIVIHRPMTWEELKQLQREQARPVAAHGFYVVDILPADSAFSRPPLI